METLNKAGNNARVLSQLCFIVDNLYTCMCILSFYLVYLFVCSVFIFRPWTIRNTQQPVMCGVMEWYYLKYGVLDTNHLVNSLILLLVIISKSGHVLWCVFCYSQVIALVNSKHCQAPPPGCSKTMYQLMVECWWVKTLTLYEHTYKNRSFGWKRSLTCI